jgi:hypothetical protein
MEAQRKEILEIVDKVEKENESNGRFNACQEIKEALNKLYK